MIAKEKANLDKDKSIATAQLSSDTSKYVADKSTSKDAPKVALFKQLSKFKDYQKEDGSVDVEKIMSTVTPPSSMYPGKNEADIKIARIEGYQKIIEGLTTKEGPEAAQAFMKTIPFDVYIEATEQQSKTADSIIGQ